MEFVSISLNQSIVFYHVCLAFGSVQVEIRFADVATKTTAHNATCIGQHPTHMPENAWATTYCMHWQALIDSIILEAEGLEGLVDGHDSGTTFIVAGLYLKYLYKPPSARGMTEV